MAILTRYHTSIRMKNAVTWKSLFRGKWTFLSNLDLPEAINWPLAGFCSKIYDHTRMVTLICTPCHLVTLMCIPYHFNIYCITLICTILWGFFSCNLYLCVKLIYDIELETNCCTNSIMPFFQENASNVTINIIKMWH